MSRRPPPVPFSVCLLKILSGTASGKLAMAALAIFTDGTIRLPQSLNYNQAEVSRKPIEVMRTVVLFAALLLQHLLALDHVNVEDIVANNVITAPTDSIPVCSCQ